MINLNVPSMSCGHCVRAVTQAVQQLDAQAKVDVDLVNHTVQVQTEQPREAVARVLSEAGYAPA